MQKLFKYTLVGASAAVVNWGMFFVCAKLLLLHYIIAGILSFIIATLWNFLFAKRFVFVYSKHSLVKETTLIYAVSFVGLCIDILALSVCVEFMQLNAMISKIIATAVAFVFNFSLRNFVIYGEQKNA